MRLWGIDGHTFDIISLLPGVISRLIARSYFPTSMVRLFSINWSTYSSLLRYIHILLFEIFDEKLIFLGPMILPLAFT